MLFCAVLQISDLFPLPGPRPQELWSNVNSQDHTDEDAYMIAKGVTQEEIEEFHRSSMNITIEISLKNLLLILFYSLAQMVSLRPVIKTHTKDRVVALEKWERR